MAAKREGVDIQVQGADRVVGHVVQVQDIFELAAFAKKKVADHPVATLRPWAFNVGKYHIVIVAELRAHDSGGAQQALGQFLSKFGVNVVSDSRGGVVTDFQQGANFAIDGGVFAGIIEGDLNQAKHGSQRETDQHCQARLLERQTVGERYIHGVKPFLVFLRREIIADQALPLFSLIKETPWTLG